MRHVPRWLLVVLLVVLLLVLAGGGVLVVSIDRKKFLELVEAEVERQLEELRPDLTPDQRTAAARIVAAQAAVETNYGHTPAWKQGWNFGNVTAGSSWTGPVVEAGDTAPDPSNPGAYLPITQRFRKYGSLADAVSDYFRLLGMTRYRAARDALFAGDAQGFATELRAAGYYTAPLAEYESGILAALGGFA